MHKLHTFPHLLPENYQRNPAKGGHMLESQSQCSSASFPKWKGALCWNIFIRHFCGKSFAGGQRSGARIGQAEEGRCCPGDAGLALSAVSWQWGEQRPHHQGSPNLFNRASCKPGSPSSSLIRSLPRWPAVGQEPSFSSEARQASQKHR